MIKKVNSELCDADADADAAVVADTYLKPRRTINETFWIAYLKHDLRDFNIKFLSQIFPTSYYNGIYKKEW